MLLKRFIVGTNELEEVIQAGNDENARNQPLSCKHGIIPVTSEHDATFPNAMLEMSRLIT